MGSPLRPRRGNPRRRLRLASLCLLFAAASCDGPTDPQSEFAAADRAVDRWVERHRDGWTVSLDANGPLKRPEWSKSCARNPESGFTALRYAAAGTEIDLFFRCPLGPAARAEDLAAAFSHVVLQELPHGIESSGWRFRVLTPSSSVDGEVTFTRPAPGRLRIGIATPLYAVSGHSVRPACEPPADAPSPEGCYLVREHRAPLRLTLAVPFDGTELR